MSHNHAEQTSVRGQPRIGFTLVELLVVIAIIAILITLLLPAVQAAREAARRVRCQNNLKQLALAALNYHNANGRLPPAGSYVPNASLAGLAARSDMGPNWVILILPYLEQQPLFDSFTLEDASGAPIPVSDPLNRQARGTHLDVMNCPSDFGHQVKFEQRAGPASRIRDNWARGNYAANAGNAALGGRPDEYRDRPPERKQFGTQTPGWVAPWRGGVMAAQASARIADITDGTSNTIMLSEVRVGLNRHDPRGVWAWSTAGASALYWHGWHFGGIGSANGPNNCDTDSDDIFGCLDAVLEAGPNGTLQFARECMSCRASNVIGGQAGARSQHRGGVYAALCDGSVHWMSETIETSFRCCSPWDRLILRRDGEVVGAGDF